MRILFLVATLIGCGPDRQVRVDAEAPQLQGRGGAAVEVWFAPDDDVLSVELEAIQRVVDARRADPDPEADYRIRYAVYNLRNPDIVAALIQARQAGVGVQILLDADQLDPERTWNQADEALIDAGFSFAPDHRELDASQHGIELVGIAGSGLMHLKTRLFTTPSGTELLTGSLNPGDNALLNDETLHRVRSPRIVEAYAQAFERVLADASFDNTWDDTSPINVLFGPHASGPNAATQLMDWIVEEDEQILIAAYSLRDLVAPGYQRSLVQLLGDKAAAGVPVVVITDQKQSDAWGDPTEDELRALGVQVYEATNLASEFCAMHAKSVVLGRTAIRVVTDTANLTSAGLGNERYRARNIESSLFFAPELEGGRVGRRYLAQMLVLLDRYAWQSEDGDAPYDQIEAELLSLPGWPVAQVRFDTQAHTDWGEQLWVTGDRAELGRWGTEHWGVPLSTSEASYPSWDSEGVALPLGARLAYKYVARSGDSVRWEDGEDRVLHVVPAAGSESVSVSDTWR